MRLKRLMSIVLAAILVMSFAMSASAASTLYYAQDFNYADITKMQADVTYYGTVGALFKDIIFDVVKYRSSGKNILADHGALFNTGNAEIKANKDGNNYLYGKDGTERSIAFITNSSWDATAANRTETYVISLNYDPVSLSGGSNGFANLIGYKSDTSNYMRARILNMAAGSIITANSATTWSAGKDLGFKAGGETKRVALSFKYDSTAGHLKRSVFVDDNLIEGNLSLDLANVTSIDGASFALRGGYFPGIGKLRMYTIDDAEGFKVTADGIDDNKRVPVNTSSVAITFTQPVSDVTADAVAFTLKKGTETVDTLSGNIVTAGTVGGSYVSTATVTLPTLEEGADYEIVVTGVKNELGAELTDNTISFSTPKPPITTAAPTITNATVGAMSEASVAVSNNTVDESKTISVIYAVYNTAGALCDVVYANDTVAADTTATISAGIKLGSDAARVKAMVWDGLSNINPFTGFVSADVAAQ